MFKKIMKVTARVLIGIFLFYLFLSLIVVPVGGKWAIQSQGTKALAHPVKVRWVSFNPFLLRFSIKGLEVLDAQKQILIGFDRFAVDVSFIRLFKKEYRVEALLLDGLKVNAALLPGGKINLMDLVPANAGTPAAPAPEAVPAKAEEPLPLVIVDDIHLKNGNIQFLDKTVTPNFTTTLGAMDIHVTGFSTVPGAQTKVAFSSSLNDKGKISVEAALVPLAQPLQMETAFTLNDYILQVLTPYVGKYTGRAVGDGKLDLRMDYRISDNKLTASHKLLIQRFDFGEKIESPDALPLPFGLAVALLEDPQGKISITLPVTGDMSAPEFHYFHLIGQVARNFLMKLITKPFTFLASTLGSESGTEELGYVKFAPGKAELSDAEKEKLGILVKGLKERPKLLLEINGSYDPDADWKAIKTDVFNKDYADLRKESTKSEADVYQQLYQRRFGVRDLWQLTKSFRDKEGNYDEDKLNTEIKRQLIESGQADKLALEALAQTRANVIYEFMTAAGFDEKRLSQGGLRTSQSSMGAVPMEFTLTVFDASEPAAEESAPSAPAVEPAPSVPSAGGQ